MRHEVTVPIASAPRSRGSPASAQPTRSRRRPPSPTDLAERAQAWRPHHGVAAIRLWLGDDT